MSDEKFDLVFKGQLAKSAELNTAVRNLAQLFKIDLQKAKALFSGKTVVLKRSLDFAVASKYRVAIKKAGALVELLPRETPAVQKEDKKPEHEEVSRPKPQGKAVFGARELTANPAAQVKTNAQSQGEDASEIQALQTPANSRLESKIQVEGQLGSSDLALTDENYRTPTTEPAHAEVNAPDYNLSPVGEDLLLESEKEPRVKLELDLSDISLKEVGGTLLNEDEFEEIVALPVDDSAFEVEVVGADVLKPEERKKLVAVDIDVSALSVGEPGENLAPAKPAPPPAPDTSNISLAEE